MPALPDQPELLDARPAHAAQPTFDARTLSGAVALPDWGVIRVVGEDAASFLHGQLTHDFVLLGADRARLAAYCNPKGRMWASFIGFKRPDQSIWLLCQRDVLPTVLKRLSMFVLRAKAKLSDASAELTVYGLVGAAADATGAVWGKSDEGEGTRVRLPDAQGRGRHLWVAPAGSPAPAPAAGTGLSLAQWQWLEVRSAVVPVGAPLSEALVPQMLNYESVDGVNFKKGCYPGQEVVARSQFRGSLKRRAFLAHSPAPAQVGQEVFHSSDAEQPTGVVAAAAAHPVAGWDLVVSMQVGSAQDGSLRLGASDGPALALLPLPYALRDDI